MIWLVISILCNTLLLLILKGFERYKVNMFPGIVVNYVVAGFLGLAVSNSFPLVAQIPSSDWWWAPLIMGSLFISIFVLIGRTTVESGVSVATVANKMSVVVPVVAAVFLYQEQLQVLKIAGIILALGAVYMTTLPAGRQATKGRGHLLLPALVFIGSGIIDAFVNHVQKVLVPVNLIPLFISCSFLTAFIIGSTILGIKLMKKEFSISIRDVIGGVILGIPNYFSIYAITKALDAQLMDSSALYPVNNMGIVMLSAVGAFLLFREKLSALNWAGILLAMLAIGLIAVS
jgi:drug/metabolite transporter (DMT)-like permease